MIGIARRPGKREDRRMLRARLLLGLALAAALANAGWLVYRDGRALWSAAPDRPLPVPAGDQEIAWLHTTTNYPTWERFVAGALRARQDVPGLRVDDSRAFLD